MGDRHEPEDLSAQFAHNVRIAREQLSLSQAQLAKRMANYGYRWVQNTIQRIEHQQRRVDIAEAAALARALDSSVVTLLSSTATDDHSNPAQIRRALTAVDETSADLHRARRRHEHSKKRLAGLNPAALETDDDLRAAAIAALESD